MDIAAVIEERRGGDAVQRRQPPFSPPVEVHDRKLARQANVDLDDLALLLLQRVRPAEAVRHQNKDVGRQYLGHHAVLRLVVGKPHRHTPVVEFARACEDVAKRGDGAVGCRALDQKPRLRRSERCIRRRSLRRIRRSPPRSGPRRRRS